jgi:uncharacterized protein YgiM (DUF1202 family)
MKTILVLLAMVLLSGCATYNDVARYNKNNHSQTKEQFYKIQNNKYLIQIGMTEKEVIDLIGEPQLKMAVLFTTQIQWVYTSHSQIVHLLWGTGRFLELYFRDGRLIRSPSRAIRRIPPSSGTTTVVTVTWTSANIRSGAENEFPVLMTVNKGDKLTVIGERGEWFNVRLEDGKEGWINSRAVKRQEYAPEKPITSAPTTFSSGTTKILTWDFSAVKSAPGNNYSSIATVRKGDKLTIMEQSGEWVRVRLENGQEGWIRSEVLE